jgi:hypothetical protein
VVKVKVEDIKVVIDEVKVESSVAVVTVKVKVVGIVAKIVEVKVESSLVVIRLVKVGG